MNKDFDGWNEVKKDLHENKPGKFYREREIWWCSVGINIGFEQDGKEQASSRPVLIIRGFSLRTCLVVPLTTSIKEGVYNLSVGVVDEKEAQASLSQIRVIDTKRLLVKICRLDKDQFDVIRKAVKDLL